MSLENVLRFSTLLNDFRKVDRKMFANSFDRDENDVEHSYMLAMLAWYICSSTKNLLNIDKVIRYALVHDLVETYAGDVFFYDLDSTARKNKDQKEKDAALRIAKEFKDFRELHEMIAAYERRADPESKFVYALDKLQPIIQIYLDSGRTWKREKITLEIAKSLKKDKVALDPLVNKYWLELVAILEEKEVELFGKS